MPKFVYKKMFDGLPAHAAQPADLNRLATIMSGSLNFPDSLWLNLKKKVAAFFGLKFLKSVKPFLFFDNSSATNDQLSPGEIPAGYTYLAQFIAHDISFADRSDRHVESDLPFATPILESLKEPKNKRKPTFDLETIYGNENPTNEGEMRRHELMQDHFLKLPLLKLGNTETIVFPCDVSRKYKNSKANIVDPRNDENLILAQTQVAFTKFHNAIVVYLSGLAGYKNEAGNYDTDKLFKKARELTIRYYQTIILNDFLPRIILPSTLADVLEKVITNSASLLYKLPANGDVFIPLEFSLAGYRFGHSMIRKEYKLNKKNPKAKIDELMMFTGRGKMDGNPSRFSLPGSWIINWNFFYEIDGSPPPNIAESIDTSLPEALLKLRPKMTPITDGRANSLAALDLFRGRRFELPTGQDVAGRIPGVRILEPKKIVNLIHSKHISDTRSSEGVTVEEVKEILGEVFSEKSPLWFYILAEAELQAKETPEVKDVGKLGEVGSRIVAEVFIQLLYRSELSILKKEWQSGDDFLLMKYHGTFGMPEMLKFIQEMCWKHFKDLYPGREISFDELNPLG